MSSTAEKLMDLAEGHMREGGYHGFSFRDLAKEVGITAASVHHHFPTKTDMVIAVMQRYREKFAKLVASRPGETGAEIIAAYRAAVRDGFVAGRGMCLSGVLGAETAALPAELTREVENFFRETIEHLAAKIGGGSGTDRAFNVLATLEGGLILARAYGNVEAFDRATASLGPSLRDGNVSENHERC